MKHISPLHLPQVPMHAEVEYQIIEAIAAAIRHSKRVSRERASKQEAKFPGVQFASPSTRLRIGDFVTDLRRAWRDLRGTDSIFEKLYQMCRPDIWQDIGVIHPALTVPPIAPDIQTILYWLERAEDMASPDDLEGIAERVKALQGSVQHLGTFVRTAQQSNERADELAGQIAAILDGESVPPRGGSLFVKDQLSR